MGNLCCAREHSVQFFVQFFFWGGGGAQFNLECMGPFTDSNWLSCEVRKNQRIIGGLPVLAVFNPLP